MRATDRMGSCVGRTTAVLVGILLSGGDRPRRNRASEDHRRRCRPARQPPGAVPENHEPHQDSAGRRISTGNDKRGRGKLYESKLFANLRANIQRTGDNKVKVYFYVVEFATTIQEVIYRGVKHLKPDELETLTGLRKAPVESNRQPHGRHRRPAPLRGNGTSVRKRRASRRR